MKLIFDVPNEPAVYLVSDAEVEYNATELNALLPNAAAGTIVMNAGFVTVKQKSEDGSWRPVELGSGGGSGDTVYLTIDTETNLNGLISGNGSNLGVTSVDASPTSSSTNPVSSGGVYTALGLKAPLASPALTGTPTAPTAASGTSTTQIATTAFVANGLSGKAPTDHKSSATTYGKGDGTNYGHVKLSDDSADMTHTAADGVAATPFAVANLRDWVENLDEVLDYKAPLNSPELSGTPTAPTAAAGTNTTQIATTAFVKSAVDGALPLISFANMGTDNTQANLLAALDANNANIPVGVSAVRIGSSSNANKAMILCIKATSTAGRGFSVSPYTDINQLNLYLSTNGWSVVT